MLDYSPTKTQKLLGNPDKSANPTVSSPACAGLAGEHCIFKEVTRRNSLFYTESNHQLLAGIALCVGKKRRSNARFYEEFKILSKTASL